MAEFMLDTLPELERPVLITAFSGWSDAGEAATAAVRWLVRHLSARRAGGFDAEAFHVFTETRPTVKLVNDERRISWPGHDLFVAAGTGRSHDLALLVAKEPELRWRSYCEYVMEISRRTGATLLVTLGAFLADAPHSRPVPLSAYATDGEWWARLRERAITASNYQGPTGINSVLHDFSRKAGLPSISLWAAVPHYLPTTTNPKAALALVREIDALLGLELDLRRLENAAAFFEKQVNEAVSRDRRASGYLRDLERRSVGATDDEAEPEPAAPLPSAEEVIRDLEDFLRGRSG